MNTEYLVLLPASWGGAIDDCQVTASDLADCILSTSCNKEIRPHSHRCLCGKTQFWVKTIENQHPYFYSETLGSSLKFHHPHALEVSFLSSCLEASWSCDDKPCTFISALVWYIIKSLGKSYGIKYHTAILLAAKSHHQNTQAKTFHKSSVNLSARVLSQRIFGANHEPLRELPCWESFDWTILWEAIDPWWNKVRMRSHFKYKKPAEKCVHESSRNYWTCSLGRRLSSCRYFRMNCPF